MFVILQLFIISVVGALLEVSSIVKDIIVKFIVFIVPFSRHDLFNILFFIGKPF